MKSWVHIPLIILALGAVSAIGVLAYFLLTKKPPSPSLPEEPPPTPTPSPPPAPPQRPPQRPPRPPVPPVPPAPPSPPPRRPPQRPPTPPAAPSIPDALTPENIRAYCEEGYNSCKSDPTAYWCNPVESCIKSLNDQLQKKCTVQQTLCVRKYLPKNPQAAKRCIDEYNRCIKGLS